MPSSALRLDPIRMNTPPEKSPGSRLDFDRNHLWHPYASVVHPLEPCDVAGASGTTLTLSDGRELFDGLSSWWCASLGHRHPRLVAAAKRQLDRLPHVMFGGLTHEPAVALGRRLVEMLPEGLDRIFYSDSGSVAVEVALKMALQAQQGLGHRRRTTFATIRGGYHGDTWNAMSVCDPVAGMHSAFGNTLPVRFFAPAPVSAFSAPWNESDAEALEQILSANQDRIAALIFEPVLQGASAMRFHHPEFLRAARRLCDRYGIFLIFDEIATGFGRTGAWFAMDHAGVVPDIVTLGKALTGGMMTLAATVANERIARAIDEGTPGAFMHGPTFMANPTACAIAAEALDVAREIDAPARARGIECLLREGLEPARAIPGVRDVRVLGAVGVIEMEKTVDVRAITPMILEEHLWLRPFGPFFYTMPPLISTEDDIRRLARGMVRISDRYLAEKRP